MCKKEKWGADKKSSKFFKQDQHSIKLVSYSQYMLREIFYLLEDEEKEVREKLKACPYVFAFFSNSVGIGLQFIIATAFDFWEQEVGFRKARGFFQKYLRIHRIALKGLALDHFPVFAGIRNSRF